MAFIEYSAGLETNRLFKRLTQTTLNPKPIWDALFVVLQEQAQKTAMYIQNNMPIDAPDGGMRLEVRSGDLRRAVAGYAFYTDNVPSLRVGVFDGPALAYAGIMDQGTQKYNPDSPYQTIRPKNRALAFAPEGSRVRDAAGAPRINSPLDYSAYFGSKLAFIPYRNGVTAIGAMYDVADLKANKGRSLMGIIPAFVLLKELDLRPSYFLSRGLEATLPQIMQAINDRMREMLNGQ